MSALTVMVGSGRSIVMLVCVKNGTAGLQWSSSRSLLIQPQFPAGTLTVPVEGQTKTWIESQVKMNQIGSLKASRCLDPSRRHSNHLEPTRNRPSRTTSPVVRHVLWTLITSVPQQRESTLTNKEDSGNILAVRGQVFVRSFILRMAKYSVSANKIIRISLFNIQGFPVW